MKITKIKNINKKLITLQIMFYKLFNFIKIKNKNNYYYLLLFERKKKSII